ncbi:hypothetical protein [Amycolatopsis orientalis]|uniref:hypothetical protein n=1 Tax=Amycolatopsis orientalis TaxID=31958 RepID=UPI0011AB3352|nr:hypothetical protein [Amycolatopsis orientalis]
MKFVAQEIERYCIMRTLYEGELQIDYGQFYIWTDEQAADAYGAAFDNVKRTFAGQSSGLCGAAVRGLLYFDTGTQYGTIGARVVVTDAEPDLDDSWEDVVEVSYQAGEETSLVEWGDGDSYLLDLAAGEYRVRYAARGRDQDDEGEDEEDTEEPVEYIEITIWSAPASADRVIRITSEHGAAMNAQWLSS